MSTELWATEHRGNHLYSFTSLFGFSRVRKWANIEGGGIVAGASCQQILKLDSKSFGTERSGSNSNGAYTRRDQDFFWAFRMKNIFRGVIFSKIPMLKENSSTRVIFHTVSKFPGTYLTTRFESSAVLKKWKPTIDAYNYTWKLALCC